MQVTSCTLFSFSQKPPEGMSSFCQMRRLRLGLELRIPGLWLYYPAPEVTPSSHLSLRGTVRLTVPASRGSRKYGVRCKGGQICNMAEYFFPGPTAGFYGTDGKDGRSIFYKEVRKKSIFYYPSNHIMKRETYLLMGKPCDLRWITVPLWTCALAFKKKRLAHIGASKLTLTGPVQSN